MRIKRILFASILFVIFFSNFITNVSAGEQLHWYLKHNKGKRPHFPQEAESITRDYDAYFIDEKTSKNGEKKIYLTFDCGYENGNVERVLDVLKENNVPAAFFLLDNIIIKNSDLVVRMADEGHLVCNHTKNHKNLSSATKEEIERNLTALEKIYEEKCNRKMAKYFRFPEGSYSLEALKSVQSLGYKTIFWSFAYDDWDDSRQPNNKHAIKKILDNTHEGAVILLHPTSKTNAEILPTIIDCWRDAGYTFGTLDELTK